jgi:metallo-beta-lactamase family protein
LIESTYGDRAHPTDPPGDTLLRLIHHVCQSGGMLVIPAFAVGRTQDVLYYLRELEESNKCPTIPVFVDSPMGIDATSIYARNHDEHNLRMTELENEGHNPLRSKDVKFVRGRDESKALNKREGPGIIISSSGMASGGRITHHLLNRLPDPRNVVLFVGFQAEGTLGRKLVDGDTSVRILGEDVTVRAKVEMIASLSAHADANEIMSWLGGFQSPPKQTFVVHGEPPASEALRSRIANQLGWNATIPKYLEEFDLSG